MDILGRDDAFVAIAKPAGRIVIPGRGAAEDEITLRDEVAEYLEGPVWVVHRLDRGTSGVLLFARTREAHRKLSRAFELRDVDKRYLALVRGELFGSGEVGHPLIAIRGGLVRAARAGEDGKPSRTMWRAVERWGGGGTATPSGSPDARGPGLGASGPGVDGAAHALFTWVECRPQSGRLHQIRAHMHIAGHPLAVDPDYGGAERLLRRDVDRRATGDAGDEVVLDRVPLHAASLRFPHPTTGASVTVEAPLPPDLVRLRAILDGAA